jgi:hypothetical protein
MTLDWPQGSIESHTLDWNTQQYKEQGQTKNRLEENYRMGTAEGLKTLERGKDKTKCKSLVNVLCGTWEQK